MAEKNKGKETGKSAAPQAPPVPPKTIGDTIIKLGQDYSVDSLFRDEKTVSAGLPGLPKTQTPGQPKAGFPLPAAAGKSAEQLPKTPFSSTHSDRIMKDIEKKVDLEMKALETRLARERMEWQDKLRQKDLEVIQFRSQMAIKDAGDRAHAEKKEKDLVDSRRKLEKEVKELESHLVETREKKWEEMLKVRDEELASIKLESNLAEIKERELRTRRESELAEIKGKLDESQKHWVQQLFEERKSYDRVIDEKNAKVEALKSKVLEKEAELLAQMGRLEEEKRIAGSESSSEIRDLEKKLYSDRVTYEMLIREKDREVNEIKNQMLLFRTNGDMARERKDAEIKETKRELEKIIAEIESRYREDMDDSREKIKEKEIETERVRSMLQSEINDKLTQIKILSEKLSEAEKVKAQEMMKAREFHYEELSGMKSRLVEEDKNKEKIKLEFVERESRERIIREKAEQEASLLRNQLSSIRQDYDSRIKEIELEKLNLAIEKAKADNLSRMQKEEIESLSRVEKEKLSAQYSDKVARLELDLRIQEEKNLALSRKAETNADRLNEEVFDLKNSLAHRNLEFEKQKASLDDAETHFKVVYDNELRDAREALLKDREAIADKLKRAEEEAARAKEMYEEKVVNEQDVLRNLEQGLKLGYEEKFRAIQEAEKKLWAERLENEKALREKDDFIKDLKLQLILKEEKLFSIAEEKTVSLDKYKNQLMSELETRNKAVVEMKAEYETEIARLKDEVEKLLELSGAPGATGDSRLFIRPLSDFPLTGISAGIKDVFALIEAKKADLFRLKERYDENSKTLKDRLNELKSADEKDKRDLKTKKALLGKEKVKDDILQKTYFTQQGETLSREIKVMEKNVFSRELEINESRLLLENEKKAFDELFSGLQSEIGLLERGLNRFAGEKADLEKAVSEKESALSIKEKEFVVLKKAISEKESALSDKDKEFAGLEKTISEKESALSEKEKEFAELKKKFDEEIDNLGVKKIAQIQAKYEGEIAVREKEFSSLEKELMKTREEIMSSASGRETMLKEKISELEGLIREKENALVEAQAELFSKDAEDEAKSSLSSQELRNLREKAEKEKTGLISGIESLRQELSSLQENNSRLEAEYERIKTEYEELKNRPLPSEIPAAGWEIPPELLAEKSKLEEMLQEKEAQISRMTAEVEELKNQEAAVLPSVSAPPDKELEGKISDLAAQIEKDNRDFSEMEDRYDAERESWDESLAEKETEILELQKKINEFNMQLSKKQETPIQTEEIELMKKHLTDKLKSVEEVYETERADLSSRLASQESEIKKAVDAMEQNRKLAEALEKEKKTRKDLEAKLNELMEELKKSNKGLFKKAKDWLNKPLIEIKA